MSKRYLSKIINFKNELRRAEDKEKPVNKALFAIVSAYVTFTRVTVNASLSGNIFRHLFDVILNILFFVLCYKLITYMADKISNKRALITRGSARQKINTGSFMLYSLLAFLPVAATYLHYFPGGFSPDNAGQWQQVQLFRFNDWHPVFHTLLIWVAAQISNKYSFVVFIQTIIYSLSIGYLFSTLRAWGFSKRITNIIFFIICVNEYTRNIMLFLWKDSALSICIVILTAGLINIYLSNGDWLKSWRNITAFAVLLSAATMLRHNAFFFTVPLAALVYILYREKKNRLPSTCKGLKVKSFLLIYILTLFLIKGPLYSFLNVEYPDNTLREATGLPMTIISDVFVKNPDALRQSTKEFLLKLAPRKTWEKYYVYGNYNSIKWHSSSLEIMQQSSAREILRITLDAVKGDPANSLRAVKQLTFFVWDSTGKARGDARPHIVNNSFGIAQNDDINKVGKRLARPFDSAASAIPRRVLSSTGFHMLCLILCFTVAFPKNGTDSFIFLIPALAYNFGTMLLLSGPDYRFFHFNILVTLPVCLVLLSSARKAKA